MNLPWSGRSSSLVVAMGIALSIVALAHHGLELMEIGSTLGPAVALVVDGVPALGLAYGGVRLSRADLDGTDRHGVVIWCFAGGVLAGLVMATTMLVRVMEGRTVAEPVFPLLIAVEAGAIAGLVAGYYAVQARADARRAERVNDALTFTNDLIRHDLRNDLSAIRSYAELLSGESNDDLPESIARKTDDAVERIETTRGVTAALVGEPDLEPIDLVEVARARARQLEDTTPATVRTAFPDRAMVSANAGLRSVVDNLLENAVEHTDAAEPEVTLRVDREDGKIRLTVEDNGPGIPDKHAARLETPPMAGSDTGGLSLVATLVESYGGTIDVRQASDRGTCITLRFPAASTETGI